MRTLCAWLAIVFVTGFSLGNTRAFRRRSYKRAWKALLNAATAPSAEEGPRFDITVGEATFRSIAGASVRPTWSEQLSLKYIYPPYPKYDSPAVVAGIIENARATQQTNATPLGIEGFDLAFLGTPFASHLTSGAVVTKLLEATTPGLSRVVPAKDQQSAVVVVGPLGDRLNVATAQDFPSIHAAGADWLFPRIWIYGELPLSAAITWMQGSDRFLQAMGAVHRSDLFGSMETWKKKANLVGVSKSGLEVLTAAKRLRRQYKDAIGRVITVASPIAPGIGGSMDVPSVSRKWLSLHRDLAGKQATAAISSLRRSAVQEELRKLNTNLATIKNKHLDLAVYSSIFSEDLKDIDRDLDWYKQTARALFSAKQRHNDGATFVPMKSEPFPTILRYMENHERAIRWPGALEQALSALRSL